MNRKRSLLTAMVLIAAVGVAFAGGGQQSGGGGQAAAAAEKLIVWQSKVEITTQLEAAAAAFMKETPGVTVEVWSTTGDSYQQDLRSRFANRSGPTIFNLQPGVAFTEMANYVEDLSDLTFIKDIADNLVPKVNGKPAGVPYTVEGFGMLYNKSLVDPSQIRDYDSFVSFLKTQKAGGINGFGLSLEAYFLIGHILNTPFAVMPDMTGYIDRLNKGQVKMAGTPEFQEFARFYAAIRDNSYNPLEVNYDRECGDFATGKTAAIHQGNWCYSMFADYNVKFEMGLAPFPLGGNDKLAVSVPSAWCVSTQATEGQKAAAKRFLTWLYTSETGKRYVTDEFLFIPVVKGMTSSKLDPLSADVQRYAAAGQTIPWATDYYPPGSVAVYFVPVAQKFFASGMTPEEFLTELDAAWAQAVAGK